MLRSRKRSLDEGSTELEGGSEFSKKVRATTTPGTLRLMKDMEDLENNANIILDQPDEPHKVTMEYRVDPGGSGRCPNRFEVTVPKRYPHDVPIVRCLDGGYTCRFIDNAGLVMHSGLCEEWTAICTLGSVVQILQSIRSLFLNLQDDSAMDPTDTSYLFGKPDSPAKRSRGSNGEGQGEEDEGLMLEGSPYSKVKFSYDDGGGDEKQDVEELYEANAVEHPEALLVGMEDSNDWGASAENMHYSEDSAGNAMAIEEE